MRKCLLVFCHAILAITLFSNPGHAQDTTASSPQVLFGELSNLNWMYSDATDTNSLFDLLNDSSTDWIEASILCDEFADTFDQQFGSGPTGTRLVRHSAIPRVMRNLADGYMDVGLAFANGEYPDGAFSDLAVAYDSLSLIILNVSPVFEDASNEMQELALAFAELADPESQIGLPEELFQLKGIHVDLAYAISPDASATGSPTLQRRAAQVNRKDVCTACTTYRKTIYNPPPTCGPWALSIGALNVTIGGDGFEINAAIFADCGVWHRKCTFNTTIQIKKVCVNYNSGWDKFWAINGFGKTVTVSTFPGPTKVVHEWKADCGEPIVPPPAPPRPSIDISSSST